MQTCLETRKYFNALSPVALLRHNKAVFIFQAKGQIVSGAEVESNEII